MGKDTNIESHDHSFNPWWGCYEVGDGCDNCYAKAFDKRIGGDHWGADKPLKYMSLDYWKQPQKWDREAAQEGTTKTIICGSQCDVWDNRADPLVRKRLFELIQMTPNLLWCIYTSRIGNAKKLLPNNWGAGYPNVMLMTSVSTQKDADRDIPKLLKLPARYHGASLEPLLEAINLTHMDVEAAGDKEWCQINCLSGKHSDMGRPCPDIPNINWIVVGGESGGGAKPCVVGWIKNIVADCNTELVHVFVKQLGANPTNREGESCPHIKHRKGADMNEWPEELRVREFIEYART